MSPHTTHHNGAVHDSERPLGTLISDLTVHAGELMRGELDLARAELTETATRLGRQAAMAVAAGVLAVCATMLFGHMLALGLSAAAGMQLWAAYLIIFVAYVVLAGALGFVAWQRYSRTEVAPTHTIEHVQEDVQWLKTHT